MKNGQLRVNALATTAFVAWMGVFSGSGCEGSSGPPGSSCSVVDNGDGTATISCTDGTRVTLKGPSSDAGSGKNSLIRLDPEPPGSNCADGGTAVKSGLDLNNNGTLEDGEVTNTTYLCKQVFDGGGGDGGSGFVLDGDYTIHNSLDALVLQPVSKITGNLNIDPITMSQLSLPNLVEVGGAIAVSGGAIGKILLPALTKAGQVLIGSVSGLSTLDLSSLTTASVLELTANVDLKTALLGSFASANQVTLTQNGLTTVPLSKLKSVADLHIDGTAFTDLSGFTKLTTISGTLVVTNNQQLTSLNGLGGVTGPMVGLQILGNGALTTMALPGLSAISTNGGQSVISGNPALTSVSLPGLTSVADKLVVSGNSSLASVSLPSLATIDTLDVNGDPSLTALALPALTNGSLLVNTDTVLASVSAPVLALAPTIVVHSVPALKTLSFPALTTASSHIEVRDAAQLQTLAFAALTSTGALAVNYNPSLTSLTAPAFATTTGAIELRSDTALTSVTFGALTTAASITLYGNTALTSVSLPGLTTVGDLELTQNVALNSLTLTKLASTSGSLKIKNGALTTIAAPSLVSIAIGLELGSLPNLTTLTFPALKTVTNSLWVHDNASLKPCTVDALLANLTVPPWSVTKTNNTGVGSCP